MKVTAPPCGISFPQIQSLPGGADDLWDEVVVRSGVPLQRRHRGRGLLCSGLAVGAARAPVPSRGRGASAGAWLVCTGYLPSAVFAVDFLQVMALLSGDGGLTVGWDRGESPVDARPSVPESWRCQVTYAATPMKRFPLKIPAGDTAAASKYFGVVSTGMARSWRAAADRLGCRGHQGLNCYFLFSQGVFCNLLTAYPTLEGSCTVVFLEY